MDHHERPTNRYFHRVETNPNNPCPPEILKHIIGVRVTYFTFSGNDLEGVIEVHKDLEQDVKDFFALAYDLGFPLSRVSPASKATTPFDEDRLIEQNISSGFNYQTPPTDDKPSAHALGRAIDVNPGMNPRYLHDSSGNFIDSKPDEWRYFTGAAGTLNSDHALVTLMRSRNWKWGGDQTPENGSVELYHFEKPE